MKTFGFTIIIAAALLAMAIALPAKEDQGNVAHRAIFKVENLTCGACFTKINQGLSSVEGFAGMGTNLFRRLVAVDFNAPLTPEKIKDVISGLGYPAVLDTVEPVTEKESFAYLNRLRQGPGAGGGCCAGGTSYACGNTSKGNESCTTGAAVPAAN